MNVVACVERRAVDRHCQREMVVAVARRDMRVCEKSEIRAQSKSEKRYNNNR